MRQLLETDDLAELTFVDATLRAVGIRCYPFEQTSMRGVERQNQRIMVADEDFETARTVLAEAFARLKKKHG